MKGYTDFMAPFYGIDIATKSRGKMKYFDWEKGRKIIEDAIHDNPLCTITIGLIEDWNNTSDIIYSEGEWCEPLYFYGCSTWATPIVDIDNEEIECWTYTETEEREAPSEWWKNKVNENRY